MTDFDPVAVLKELEQIEKGDYLRNSPVYMSHNYPYFLGRLKWACEEVVRLRAQDREQLRQEVIRELINLDITWEKSDGND